MNWIVFNPHTREDLGMVAAQTRKEAIEKGLSCGTVIDVRPMLPPSYDRRSYLERLERDARDGGDIILADWARSEREAMDAT